MFELAELWGAVLALRRLFRLLYFLVVVLQILLNIVFKLLFFAGTLLSVRVYLMYIRFLDSWTVSSCLAFSKVNLCGLLGKAVDIVLRLLLCNLEALQGVHGTVSAVHFYFLTITVLDQSLGANHFQIVSIKSKADGRFRNILFSLFLPSYNPNHIIPA